MPWKLPRPRFGLRTLLVVVLASGIGLAFWTNPGRWRTYRNQQARQRIDPYELAAAGDGNPRNVPLELVAILGDSRLKHWGFVGGARILTDSQLASIGRDERLRIWNIQSGRQTFVTEAKAMAISGDRRYCFFATLNGEIRRIDANDSKQTVTLPTSRAI